MSKEMSKKDKNEEEWTVRMKSTFQAHTSVWIITSTNRSSH